MKLVIRALAVFLAAVVGSALFERLAPRDWVVAGNRSHSRYVKNLEACHTVRVRVRGRWRVGTARFVPEDDPRRRLLSSMNPVNILTIGIAGRDLATIRIDLDPALKEEAPAS